MSKGPHIAVVGAGIVGSAIALELASRGAVVTLVDAGGERASENSFGWINASWFNRSDYARLRHFSMGVWRGWADRIPGLDPHWSGCLTWDLDDAGLNAFVRDHGAMGYAIRMVDRDTICRIEPGLVDPPNCAALVEAEGFIEAGAAASALRAAAVAVGARLVASRVAAVETGALRLTGGAAGHSGHGAAGPDGADRARPCPCRPCAGAAGPEPAPGRAGAHSVRRRLAARRSTVRRTPSPTIW